MKRLFYALLFAAGTTLSLGSCMNGDYDANPKADLSKVPNPSYDPGDGSVARGTMRCKVNGQVTTFPVSVYTGDGPIRVITGAIQSNGGQKTTIITFNISDYTGVKTYELDGNGPALAAYAITEVSAPQNALIYGVSNPSQKGSGQLKLTSDANNELKGEFNFTAYQTNPTISTTEKIVVTDGKFFAPKQ